MLIFDKDKKSYYHHISLIPRHLTYLSAVHHYIAEHPANKIIKDHYHLSLQIKDLTAVPYILKLITSPVIRLKLTSTDLKYFLMVSQSFIIDQSNII